MLRIKKLIIVISAILVTVVSIDAQNPGWVQPVNSNYSYTANVIASINLNGKRSDNASDRIAFFVGNELRGLSIPVSIGGLEYLHFVTLYSNESVEQMNIKIYHQASKAVYDVAKALEFKVQSIYGSIDNPLLLNIYTDNNSPISLNSVPLQHTIEGLAFIPIDMADYLVQPDNNAVVWSYTPNPDLSINFSGSVLNIEGNPGFSGLTQLTIRATEVRPSLEYAETVISLEISELYAAPAWYNIPGQGIVKGGQFTPVNLHDYEYQFGGPAIQYDYKPLILKSENISSPEAIPNWVLTESYVTNMTITSRLDYTPKYQFHHNDDVLAAFVNNEIRGIAMIDPVTGLYYLTIGGTTMETDSVTLMFYSGEMKKIITLENVFPFEPHKIIGTTDDPFIAEFAPLVPNIPDYPITGGNHVMDLTIVDSCFIGTIAFEFYAFDPMYPQYLRAETESSFCIVSQETDLTTLYIDEDGDGFGNFNIFIQTCGEFEGYVINGDDCDDNDTNNYPNNIELCDGQDNNCNGIIDEECPLDPCDARRLFIHKINQPSYHAKFDISSDATVLNTWDIEYFAGHHIVLSAGFEVEGGGAFLAQIEDCDILGK